MECGKLLEERPLVFAKLCRQYDLKLGK